MTSSASSITSERIREQTRAGKAISASLPPFTAEICFRTAFNSCISAPARKSSPVVCCFSSKKQRRLRRNQEGGAAARDKTDQKAPLIETGSQLHGLCGGVQAVRIGKRVTGLKHPDAVVLSDPLPMAILRHRNPAREDVAEPVHTCPDHGASRLAEGYDVQAGEAPLFINRTNRVRMTGDGKAGIDRPEGGVEDVGEQLLFVGARHDAYTIIKPASRAFVNCLLAG